MTPVHKIVNGVHGGTGGLVNGNDGGTNGTVNGVHSGAHGSINGIHGGNSDHVNSPQHPVQDNATFITDLDGVDQPRLEPIAVIAFSLKFPQDATSPEIPSKGGHFLEEPLGNFDAPFFSITPTEAAAIDPQHRLLLETAYRAFENAGISMEKASNSKTSVYTGCLADDCRLGIFKDPDMLPTYSATWIAVAMLAARLSWFFNLTGPCVNLDSACSSSMMALDLPCQGLRNRDSNMALMETPSAAIRSTGSNQDGRTPGITQPNRDAQEVLINETYAKAGLDMQTTRYVEAHGTGTAIGDPIEASAIGLAFRKYPSAEEPMYIGAMKSNIGHLEGASGVAGVIKAILILETGVIPPNVNIEHLNPDIDADYLRLKFPLLTSQQSCWKPLDNEGGLARLADSYDAHISELTSSLSPTEATAFLSNLAYTLANEIQQSGYWVKNLTSPVMFSDALAQMCSEKNSEAKLETIEL
ncbi:hypothetical protein HO133_006047 [Letharia lupina]|uniref:Ketosynthase family 3 (KS3) domain-containing protein n=1 Tax=Letharia lupina TaxID=560253 RepID=A0A8H6C8R5_9LECA|nr:uncharacterized protein HO133_006047 [Letharia lupina]KAF6218696.1 hypothetical protein HO133_006047 [Letharia lupina]